MLQFHPLFLPEPGLSPPDFAPEPIAMVQVYRHTATQGRISAPRTYTPDEFPDQRAFFEMFGGGTWELVARRQNGTVYAKRMVKSPLPVKPFDGEAGSASAAPDVTPPSPMPTAASAFAGDPMIAFLIESQRQASAQQQAMMAGMLQMMGTVLAASVGNRGTSELPEMMKAFAELAKAQQPPAAPPTPLSEALALTAQMDKAVERRVAQVAELAPKPATAPAVSLEDEIGAVLPLALQALQMFTGGGGGGTPSGGAAPAAAPAP